MKSVFTFILVVVFITATKSQSYSIQKIQGYTNGIEGLMEGVPGDLFTTMITFTNSSSNTASLYVNRFLNNKPPYWAICYCYVQCHSPREDSILVTIQPFSTEFIVLQFKTDSVNPGIAYNSFEIYELGYQNSADTIYMTASTQQAGTLGIKSQKTEVNMNISPNPVYNTLNITSSTRINSVLITDFTGKLIYFQKYDDAKNVNLEFQNYQEGIYNIKVNTDHKSYSKRIIKN